MLVVWLLSKKVKGQIIALEFLLVSIVLVALFIVSLNLWNQSSLRIRENVDRTNLEITAFSLSDQLIKFAGEPSDWEDNVNKIFSLGLAKENHVLDSQKIDQFINLDYTVLRKNLGIENYQFYFRITNTTGEVLAETGIFPNSSTNMAINSKRLAWFKGDIVFVDVIVWQ